jgi:MFS family permease
MRGMMMSSALFGCLAGALCSGFLADRLGRKRLLITSGLFFTLSAIWTALCSGIPSFMAARILGGVGIGLASNLSPMYIAEVSPAKNRGRLVSINQLTIVIGIFAAQIVNFLIAPDMIKPDQLRLLLDEPSAKAILGETAFVEEKQQAINVIDREAFSVFQQSAMAQTIRYLQPTSDEMKAQKAEEDKAMMTAFIQQTWNGKSGWRWMFGSETVPALLFFLLMFFVPESPRWLIKYDRTDQARLILTRLGGDDYAEQEIKDIQSTLSQEEIAKVRFSDLLEPKVKLMWRIGVILAIFQQWCGINVIFNYAQEVFSAAGYEVGDLMFTIVITGIVNLLFTFVALFTVDRIGRKPLMMIGASGLAVIYLILGIGFQRGSTGVHMLILVVSAIACYSMTLAPVTWVILSEIFPNRIRGGAMAISVFALWFGCLTLIFFFPILHDALGAHGAFWMFAGICTMGLLYIFTHLPETKGQSLEDIERQWLD